MSTTKEETTFPHTHPNSGHDGVGKDTTGVEAIVKYHDMRQDNPQQYVKLWQHVAEDPQKETILRTVSYYDGCVYQTLYDVCDTSERTVRNKVNELCDDGVLEKNGRPATISFVDDDTWVLSQDVFSVMDEAATA